MSAINTPRLLCVSAHTTDRLATAMRGRSGGERGNGAMVEEYLFATYYMYISRGIINIYSRNKCQIILRRINLRQFHFSRPVKTVRVSLLRATFMHSFT